jgi:hypothetical protein
MELLLKPLVCYMIIVKSHNNQSFNYCHQNIDGKTNII